MAELNMIEIAQEYKAGKISRSDERLKKVEESLAELASTEDGRQELAETIAIYLDENFHTFDIAPMICTYKNFKLGDKAEFRLKKKGIVAYWIAPNSSTPKSRNYQTTLTMDFDSLSVRPEILVDELKAGRVDSYATMITDAQEALTNAISGKVFTILDQSYNASTNKDYYATCSTSLTSTALNKALDTVYYKTGKRPVIIGDMLLTNQIRDFTGYDQDTLHQIVTTGYMGQYRGSNIISLPECKSPTGDILVPKDRLYIVSQNVGYAGTYGEAKSGQETSLEDWSWNARIDKEWGMCITEATKGGMYVIEIV